MIVNYAHLVNPFGSELTARKEPLKYYGERKAESDQAFALTA